MTDEERLPEPILGDRLAEAAGYAVELHARQARKGTTIPYVMHLFAVCSLALEDGADEDEAIAALLHDGPEDQGGQATLDEIGRRFGPVVAMLVDGLTDTLEDPKPAWRPRKEAYMKRLAGEPESVMRVSIADKLHNIARSRSISRTAGSPPGSGSMPAATGKPGSTAPCSRSSRPHSADRATSRSTDGSCRRSSAPNDRAVRGGRSGCHPRQVCRLGLAAMVARRRAAVEPT